MIQGYWRTHRWSTRMAAVVPVVLALIGSACGATTPAAPSAAPASAAATAPAVATTKANVPGVTDTEVVIGGWGPQDGPAGFYGAIDRTLAAYFTKVNDDGGINGRKIRFIYENDS